MCHFKIRSTEPLGGIADGRRFHTGVFIGIDRRTGQYMLYSDGDVKLARTVTRVPEIDKWNFDMYYLCTLNIFRCNRLNLFAFSFRRSPPSFKDWGFRKLEKLVSDPRSRTGGSGAARA